MTRLNVNRNSGSKRSARKTARNTARSVDTKRTLNIDWGRVRLGVAASLFVMLWLALWGRAFYVQMIDGPFLAERARKQHTTTEAVAGRRGSILDRTGQVLARSVECRSVYINPHDVENIDAAAPFLSETLGLPLEQVRAALGHKERHFVWLARKIDDGRAAAISRAQIPGVVLAREYDRVYPFKHLAGQLLGFVGLDDKGLEGLERSFDDTLGGLSSRNVVQRDAAGKRFYLRGAGEDALQGQDVTLTLDVHVQFFAEEAIAAAVERFDARWGGCLVVDVESGDILAWAQAPFFNPNTYRSSDSSIYRNRLAADALEPGSTLKPFLVAAALQEKVVEADTIFNCENGQWKTKGSVIRDTGKHAELTVSKILRYSSNIGCAKIGLELGASKYHQYLSQLGFGVRSGLPVADSRGILRAPREWGDADTMSTAFGQSISVTGLQMAQAYLALANHGNARRLRLVVDEESNDTEQFIFSGQTVKQVVSMMRDVVEEDGSGTRARISGLEIGGKTGTAQKADRTGKYGTGRMASFVGFAPVENPRFLILVMVDEPLKNPYGGVVAAPVFQHVLSRTLAYYGELPDTMQADKLVVKKDRKKMKEMAEKDDSVIELERTVSSKVRGTATSLKEVPNVVGKSLRVAVEQFARRGVVPQIKGEGHKVVRQIPAAGVQWTNVSQGECTLWLSEL